eukprot:363364-Chlamydomonas_euryale.AAC.5
MRSTSASGSTAGSADAAAAGDPARGREKHTTVRVGDPASLVSDTATKSAQPAALSARIE